MKRLLTLLVAAAAFGTGLRAQEPESVTELLVNYGATDYFTCEIAEGDGVAEYFLFHDDVPEFLDDATLPRTHKIVHFVPNGNETEEVVEQFITDFAAMVQSKYDLFYESETVYAFIRCEGNLVYEYVIYDASQSDPGVHIWVLQGDYDIDMFVSEQPTLSGLLYDFADSEGFYVQLVSDRETIAQYSREVFDLSDVIFGDNLILFSMEMDSMNEDVPVFLERLNDILDRSYTQYGQTEEGGRYYMMADENSLYETVFIFLNEQMLLIQVLEGEMPLDNFVVG